MTNFKKYDMFTTIAKAYGNEISEPEPGTGTGPSNKDTLRPASFANISSMLGAL